MYTAVFFKTIHRLLGKMFRTHTSLEGTKCHYTMYSWGPPLEERTAFLEWCFSRLEELN